MNCKEFIDFYKLRKRQRVEDFKQMTDDYKPKLAALTKQMIVNKQSLDQPTIGLLKLNSPKRSKPILASISKSKEVEVKIEQEMRKRECKFSLSEVPTIGYDQKQACRNIHSVIVPLIATLEQQLASKYQQLHQLEIDEDEHKDIYIYREEYKKMLVKRKRLAGILNKLDSMQQKTEERIYLDSLKKIAIEEEEQEITIPFSDQRIKVSKKKIEFEEPVQFDNKLREQYYEQELKEKREHRLQLGTKIQKFSKKLGILSPPKVLSESELKAFLRKCKSESNSMTMQDIKQPAAVKLNKIVRGPTKLSIKLFPLKQYNSFDKMSPAQDIQNYSQHQRTQSDAQETLRNHIKQKGNTSIKIKQGGNVNKLIIF